MISGSQDTSPEKPKRKKKPQTKRAPKKNKKVAANSSQSTIDSSFSDTFTSGKGKAVKKKKKVNNVFVSISCFVEVELLTS